MAARRSTPANPATTSGTDEDTIFIEEAEVDGAGDDSGNGGNAKGDSDGVVYVGIATRRILTKADWENIGIKNQETVEWNRTNKFTIPVADFSKSALNYLKTDNGFTVPHSS